MKRSFPKPWEGAFVTIASSFSGLIESASSYSKRLILQVFRRGPRCCQQRGPRSFCLS